jgi:hypothetical protein
MTLLPLSEIANEKLPLYFHHATPAHHTLCQNKT